LLEEVFHSVDQPWRGMGVIPQGGMALKPPYDTLEARQRFGLADPAAGEEPACPTCSEVCISGEVLQGRATPDQCPSFGGACTPEHPLGAPMVTHWSLAGPDGAEVVYTVRWQLWTCAQGWVTAWSLEEEPYRVALMRGGW
jgi:hydrogenase expression/formation protein HypD